jgi:hypothetical protein
MDSLSSFGSSLIFYFVAFDDDWRLPIREKYMPKPILAWHSAQRVILRTVIDRVYRQQISYYVNNNLILLP